MNDSIQTQAYLPHERLDVYRLAVELRRSLAPLSKVRGIAPLRDQLFRAADSVVLNIAEGAGRNSRNDKQRHYEIAKGSATESAAALELLFHSGILSETAFQERRKLAIRIVQMLSRLCGPPR
jgi:four helix bundle protein